MGPPKKKTTPRKKGVAVRFRSPRLGQSAHLEQPDMIGMTGNLNRDHKDIGYHDHRNIEDMSEGCKIWEGELAIFYDTLRKSPVRFLGKFRVVSGSVGGQENS